MSQLLNDAARARAELDAAINDVLVLVARFEPLPEMRGAAVRAINETSIALAAQRMNQAKGALLRFERAIESYCELAHG